MNKLYLKNWRDIKDRKAQFGAIILLVALGVASYVALISAYLNLSASYETVRARLNLADLIISTTDATTSVIHDIKETDGVEAVEGRLIIDTGLKIDRNDRGTARVIGIPGDRRPDVNNLLVTEGSYLTGLDDRQVLIDKYFADTAGKGPGDTLDLITDGFEETVRIRGVVVSPEYIFPIRAKEELPTPGQLAVVFMVRKEAEDLFGKEDVYNDLAVLLEPGADPDKVINRVEDAVEPHTVLATVEQEDQPSNFRLREEIRQNRELAAFMPPLILIISSLSLYIALSRLVQSQRGVVGLAKALGYGNFKLLRHYLIFALFVAAAGSVAGFGIGYWLALEITELYATFLRLPFLETNIYPEQVSTAALLSLIAATLGGLVPAYGSTRLTPAAAMRADPNLLLSKTKVPLVERALGPAFRLPFAIKVPLRNVFRAKKRSAYTIIGIAFALVLTVATWSSFDTIDFLIDYQFRQVDNWDMTAAFTEFVDNDRVEEVEDFHGVRSVEPALQIPAELRAADKDGTTHEGGVTAMVPGADWHGFDILRGENPRAALRGGGLIMPEKIADKLGVTLGDKVSIKSPYNDDRQTVTLTAVSDELLGAPIFVGRAVGRELIDAERNFYNVMYLRVDEGRTQVIEKDLYEDADASRVMVKSELIEHIETQLEFSRTTFAILLAFAFSMAFAITYNTLTTNVLERTRELATMRTIGEDLPHLAAAVTLENLILAAAGIPIGIYLGIEAANALYESFSTEAFSFRVVLYPESYVSVTAGILAVLLVSEIPAVRRIFRLDLAEATKAME